MRRQTKIIRALSALALTASLAAEAAAQSKGQCPKVTVRCADTAAPGSPVTFSVEVADFDGGAKPSFNWVVSAGVITSGQGSNVITVDTDGVTHAAIEATVEVSGLPESRPKNASCAVNVFRCGIGGWKIDEYGAISLGDEKARLDNFAVELNNDPTAQGYIIAYGGRRGRAGEAQRRADRARDYLSARSRGHEVLRLVTVDGGFREDAATELFIVPSGAKPPAATPTIGPAEVQTVRPKPRRSRARRAAAKGDVR